jgi:hypothetical protein
MDVLVAGNAAAAFQAFAGQAARLLVAVKLADK